jgi:hypothetical protein
VDVELLLLAPSLPEAFSLDVLLTNVVKMEQRHLNNIFIAMGKESDTLYRRVTLYCYGKVYELVGLLSVSANAILESYRLHLVLKLWKISTSVTLKN